MLHGSMNLALKSRARHGLIAQLCRFSLLPWQQPLQGLIWRSFLPIMMPDRVLPDW